MIRCTVLDKNVQLYVIKFVSDWRQVFGLMCTLVSSTYKIDRHDVTGILLEVVLNVKTDFLKIFGPTNCREQNFIESGISVVLVGPTVRLTFQFPVG